MNINFFK